MTADSSQEHYKIHGGVECATDMGVNALAQARAHEHVTGRAYRRGTSMSRYASAAWRTWCTLSRDQRIEFIDAAIRELAETD